MVISPQSGLMVMMHQGHYVQLQNCSSWFFGFQKLGQKIINSRDGKLILLSFFQTSKQFNVCYCYQYHW